VVTNYYNASNHFSAPVRREPKPYRPYPEQERCTKCDKETESAVAKQEKKQEFDSDAVLILGLVLLLLASGCDDTLLLIALGYLILF